MPVETPTIDDIFTIAQDEGIEPGVNGHNGSGPKKAEHTENKVVAMPEHPGYEEHRYLQLFQPLDQRASQSHWEIFKNTESDEDIASVLAAWKLSFDRAEHLYHNPWQNGEDTYWAEFWRSKSNKYDQTLELFLHPNDRDPRKPKEERKDFSGLTRVAELLRDTEFEEKGALAEYITHKLWYAGYHLQRSAPTRGSEPSDIYVQNSSEYQRLKDRLAPVILESLTVMTAAGDSETTRRILERLYSIGERQVADEILVGETLDDEARLRFAVEYMNVFGVIPAIEAISEHTESNESVARLYEELHGEELEEIMQKLSDVYKAVEFRKYALNNESLTQGEASIVGEVIRQVGAKRRERIANDPDDDRKPEDYTDTEITVLDIGAGTGRHALALREHGDKLHGESYKFIVLEYEPQHVLDIKEQAPDLNVVRADWYNMPLPKGEGTEEYPGVFYCLGRTILHNNTPQKMTRFFDELHRVTAEDAVGVIDIPSIPKDKLSEVKNPYAEEIRRYASHLESKGVKSVRARHIFDGPDERHKYDRMAMTEGQVEAYAKLFGFETNRIKNIPINEEGLFDNSYYELTKIEDFDVKDIDSGEFIELVREIGLLDPGVDYNQYVEAWGLPLGVVIKYMARDEREALPELRRQYREGLLGDVYVERDGDMTYF